MPSARDYILDIAGLRPPDETKPPAHSPMKGRPWLAVHWRCCQTYSRVYRHRSGTHYVGRCPSCGKQVRAAVGPGGVSNRFFDAY